MTQESIDGQIEVIRAATAAASVSKEAALDFLRRAGIKDTPEIVDAAPQGTNKKRK
jgi:hypothetical protein